MKYKKHLPIVKYDDYIIEWDYEKNKDHNHKNGRFWAATTFMTHMAAIIMHVAAGHIDEDLLSRIIPPVIKGEDFSEELKIDIAHAMESGDLFSE